LNVTANAPVRAVSEPYATKDGELYLRFCTIPVLHLLS
jgi:hypothetical protein